MRPRGGSRLSIPPTSSDFDMGTSTYRLFSLFFFFFVSRHPVWVFPTRAVRVGGGFGEKMIFFAASPLAEYIMADLPSPGGVVGSRVQKSSSVRTPSKELRENVAFFLNNIITSTSYRINERSVEKSGLYLDSYLYAPLSWE